MTIATVEPSPKRENKQASTVQLFDFKGTEVRLVQIEGNPWFVGSDILTLLFGKASGNAHQYDKLDTSEITEVKPIHFNLGSGRTRRLISESGLYKLVMRSDKPEAKSFQDWVTKVVLYVECLLLTFTQATLHAGARCA